MVEEGCTDNYEITFFSSVIHIVNFFAIVAIAKVMWQYCGKSNPTLKGTTLTPSFTVKYNRLQTMRCSMLKDWFVDSVV